MGDEGWQPVGITRRLVGIVEGEEGGLLPGGGGDLGGLLEGAEVADGGEVDAAAGEEVGDGEDLEVGVFGAEVAGGDVEAGAGGLGAHRGGRLVHGDQDADLGLLAVDDVAEVADHRHADVLAGLDREDDLLGLAAPRRRRGSRAGRRSPCPPPSSARSAGRRRGPAPTTGTGTGRCRPASRPPRRPSARRPPRTPSPISLPKLSSRRFLIRLVARLRDVDADPPPPQLLRRRDRRPAAAERVEHRVARVAAGEDDAFEQGERLLGRISEAFGRHHVDWVNVRPNVLGRYTSFLIQEHLRGHSRISSDFPLILISCGVAGVVG